MLIFNFDSTIGASVCRLFHISRVDGQDCYFTAHMEMVVTQYQAIFFQRNQEAPAVTKYISGSSTARWYHKIIQHQSYMIELIENFNKSYYQKGISQSVKA